MRQLRLIGVVGLAVAALTVEAAPAPALTINSSGQALEKIWLRPNLQCQVRRAGWAALAFRQGGGSAYNGACATFVATKATTETYGPMLPGATFPAMAVPKPYAPLGPQTATNSGGNKCVESVVRAGPGTNNNSFKVTQRDCYHPPANFYTTAIDVKSLNSTPRTITVYHAGDCVVRNGTFGFGFFNALNGGIFCKKFPGASLAPPAIGFIPSPPTATRYLEAKRAAFWPRVNGAPFFNNTCACGTSVDNVAGLSATVTVGASATVSGKFRTRFLGP
ncbi:MAG TPA: hypothetical protein VJT75_18355 [Thermoleophilaceae bacterium]|nr:hypothetical protein [Thermoleophilaceae bacterium]